MPRTGAVVAVLLAALVHLLSCAHGPAPAGTARVDSLVAAPASCGQASTPVDGPAADQSAPAGGDTTQCLGHDEPTTQPPRDSAPATAALPTVLPTRHTDAPAGPAWAPPPPKQTLAAEPVGQSRARLGVWRT